MMKSGGQKVRSMQVSSDKREACRGIKWSKSLKWEGKKDDINIVQKFL